MIILTLCLCGVLLIVLAVYSHNKKWKPEKKKRDRTENTLVVKINSYRKRYGKREDTKDFLEQILPDTISDGGLGAASYRLASGDVVGAATVGALSAAAKVVTNTGARFLGKRPLENISPKSEKQAKSEEEIVDLVNRLNKEHSDCESLARKTGILVVVSVIFFGLAFVVHSSN